MTDKIKELEIKPCPFCGAEGILFTQVFYGKKALFVDCLKNCQGYAHRNKKQALKAWNKRVKENGK